MSTPPQFEQQDQQLAEILTELTDTPTDQRPTLAELTVQYPHLAEELRELWGTIMVVDAVAKNPSPDPTPATTPTPPNPPPQKLGDFQIGKEIGRGGMGIVYHAHQTSLGRDVALKLILHGKQAAPADQARFQAEVAAAALLDHPNIIPIYEVGQQQGWQYFGMKLIEGETLAQKITGQPLSESATVQIIKTVARAIQYAHQQGVIHRDLKPANILIDKDNNPHVSDFGLAKQTTSSVSLTQSGLVLGTPAYMSPEQAAGSRGIVSPASDVYSLGVILYELFTGRPPFQATTPVDTMLMVLEQEPLPPRLLNRSLNRDLELIVLRCLQKPPELRYSSAAALADDLEAFQTNEPIAARSGHLRHIVARVFRESHHASVLENWGILWMWHAAVLLVLCAVTNWLHIRRDIWPLANTPWPYLSLWGGGLLVWAPMFWALRHRAGPVTAVERQIAHAWGGSIVAVMLLFVVESLLGQPVLTLSPVLGMISGMVFVVKAGILAGFFYLHAAALFITAIVMAALQHQGWPYTITLYGVVSAATFFLPGWKYYRQSQRDRG